MNSTTGKIIFVERYSLRLFYFVKCKNDQCNSNVLLCCFYRWRSATAVKRAMEDRVCRK